MKAAYARLRDKSKTRGIPFSLTLEEFTAFAVETELLTKTGNEPGSLTVDRIDNLRGYEVGNIQPLTREENYRKYYLYDERRITAGYSWRR